MHFRHYFDAAGHGTFFWGKVNEEGDVDTFTWIYDCGSLRKSHLKGLIQQFAERMAGKETIDLVCLSHFDSDHVSGLDIVLEKFRIDTLLLPYVPLEVRLRRASELTEEQPGSARLAAYTLDPVLYLEQRDWGERISRIALIQGRRPGDEIVELNREPPPPPADFEAARSVPRRALRRPAGRPLDEEHGYSGGHGRLSSRVEVHSDAQPWSVDDIYEFLFYSKAWPNDQAPASGVSIAGVAEEVRDLILDYHLTGSDTPDPGWLDALKVLYGKHFGHTYKRRNEICLCVYAEALVAQDVEPCALFTQSESSTLRLPLGSQGRRGVLLTGDAYLNPSELNNLLTHLGDRRHKLAIMQIPHHGSDNNWSPGNAVQCGAESYVICAPGTTKHPGEVVRQDLPGYALANYRFSVAFDFHT